MYNTQQEAQCNSTRLLENALQVNMEKEFLLQVRVRKKIIWKNKSRLQMLKKKSLLQYWKIFTPILNEEFLLQSEKHFYFRYACV